MATGQRALYEDETEFEDELEFEDEGEEFLGTIARGVGGLLGLGQGESEYEDEYELEGEYEGEGEYEFEDELEFEDEGEEFLGTIARGVGGLLGLGQGESEYEDEYETEGEEFLRRIGRGFGRWLRRAAPALRRVAQVAAPIVGTAVAGPLGGTLGRGVAQLLREGEYEFEDELEYEDEAEFEDEAEGMVGPTGSRALAEMMAAVASRASSEAEAEAMIGAATMSAMSARERAQLEAVLANLVRGSAVLVRMLWRQPITRPAVRLVPAVVRSTARLLAQQPGRQVTPRRAAQVMAGQTRRILGQPRTTQRALRANARGTLAAAQRTRPVVRGAAAGARTAPRAGRVARPTGVPRTSAPTRRAAAPVRGGVGRRLPRAVPAGRRVPTAVGRGIRRGQPASRYA